MKVKRKEDIVHKKPTENYEYAESDQVFLTDQLFLYSEKVMPGKKGSKPHFHKSIDEIAVITKGELMAFEGNESTLLKAGDSILFEANSKELHFLENQSALEAEFLLFRKNIKDNDVMGEGYTFNEVTKDDFEMIINWRKQEFVSKWWNEAGEEEQDWIEELSDHLDTDMGKQFIASFDGTPFGFIQYYFCDKVEDGWWEGYPEGFLGLDLFIGEKTFLGKGHAISLLKSFIQEVIAPLKPTKLIVDPEPKNSKAIAIFLKAGFTIEEEIKTPDGDALLMSILF
jgi:RimJ/RimL family protein N-acetyltransferase